MKETKILQILSPEDHAYLKERIEGEYSINPETGLIDVKGSVDLSYENLTKIPYKFGHVCKSFFCSYNQLTSLEGCPQIVSGSFWCNGNQLTSLEGSPQTVGGNFNCYNNQLTSLEGCPKTVEGFFNCSNNQLTSLKGGPQTVKAYFDCISNKIESLKFMPKCYNQSEVISDIRKQIRQYLIDLGFDPEYNFEALMKAQENS